MTYWEVMDKLRREEVKNLFYGLGTGFNKKMGFNSRNVNNGAKKWTNERKKTCRDRLREEHPEELDIKYFGGCNSCPALYGYADKPKWCKPSEENCTKCWDREVERDVRTNKESWGRTETKTEEMSYKEPLQDARMFADDIVAAAGTDFLLTIAEAQSKFMFELLRMIKRKRGHWKSLTDCANAGVYCSVCHKKVWKEDYAECNRKNKLRSNFCPNCGAKMDEAYKEENYDVS